jgi:NAD+ diphosphatase
MPRISRAPADAPIVSFAGATLDRATGLRDDPARVLALRRNPGAAMVFAAPDGVLLDGGGRLLRASADEAAVDPVLLGLADGAALFAADLEQFAPERRDALLRRGRLVSLRDAAAVLSHAEAGIAAYLAALLNWHRRHHFCANCGAATALAEAGLVRACASCGTVHFPRTDPVVIMVVAHDDRILLGRRAGWPESRFSVLAGFVSPGETPEAAVVREVWEESGIVAYEPRYVASQPWPFPSSLMLGFEARSDGGIPAPRDGELEDVRWVTLDDIRLAQRNAGSVLLPPAISIARVLIDAWAARPA